MGSFNPGDGTLDFRRRLVDLEAALDLGDVATANAYSGTIFSAAQSDAAAFALTLPTATTAAEAALVKGWHCSVVITTADAENITIIRKDTSSDSLTGVVASHGQDALTGMTIGSNVITLVGGAAAEGDRVDIFCVGATASNTFFTATGYCST